ncbi:MAG: thiamine diphosphokinase [Clostridiales bacterium]|nr:thiamine diphosphokinase [Clostridiales bacterium]
MRAIIVTGGNPPSKELLNRFINKDTDIIIGVDKGCEALYKYNIKPTFILGDFDSASKETVEYFANNKIKIERFSPEKDYTDTHLGIKKALEEGAKEILLFGATGTRIDHTLGNIGLMLMAKENNINIEIIDDHNRAFLVNKQAVLKGKYGEVISFHALSSVVKNFTISGGKYDLEGYDMKFLEPRAICNEFLDGDINISFDSGVIMVIYPLD